MKKMILTMAALLSMTLMVAQTTDKMDRKPRKMGHEEMTTQMVSQLKLTDAQKGKVAALNKEYEDYLMPEPPKRPGKRPGGEGSASTMTDKKANAKGESEMKKPNGDKKPGGDKKQFENNQNHAKHQEYEKKLKAILTDDQYKSYQNMGPKRDRKAKPGNKKNEQ